MRYKFKIIRQPFFICDYKNDTRVNIMNFSIHGYVLKVITQIKSLLMKHYKPSNNIYFIG